MIKYLLIALFLTSSTAISDSTTALNQIERRLAQAEKELLNLNGKIEELNHLIKQKQLNQIIEAPKDTTIPEKQEEDNAQQLLTKAQLLICKREFKTAKKILFQLIEKYPDDPLVISAYFWIGEVYFSRKKFNKASVNFGSAYKTYKKNPTNKNYNKAAKSLAKLAISFKKLGQKESLDATIQQFFKEFTNANNNIKEMVKNINQKELSS